MDVPKPQNPSVEDDLEVVGSLVNHGLPSNESTLFLAHFQWEWKEDRGYNSLSLWMVGDKSYGNPNP